MKLIKQKSPKMLTPFDVGHPDYAFVETVNEAEHDDIHTFDGLFTFGVLTGYDYLFVRDCVKSLYTTHVNGGGTFSTLTVDQKRILMQLCLCTKAEALTINGVKVKEVRFWKRDMLRKTQTSRINRVEWTRLAIGEDVTEGLISLEHSNQLFTDIEPYLDKYVKTANPKVYDWINSTGDFVGTGFDSKTYATPTLKGYLVDHLVNGEEIPINLKAMANKKKLGFGLPFYLLSQVLTKVLYLSGLLYAILYFLVRLDLRGLDDYFWRMAISIDQTGNVLMSPLFNDMLIRKDGYKFGEPDETISSAIGKNNVKGSLTSFGKLIDFTLNKIDPNHSLDAIEADEDSSKQTIK